MIPLVLIVNSDKEAQAFIKNYTKENEQEDYFASLPDFWNVIESLKANGAQGILIIPIEKMIV